MAGQSSEPKRDEAVLHAKNGAKQGGGIAVVGFKRSPNQIPPLSPLCSEGPQIGCPEERSSSKGEQVGEKVVGDVSLFEIPARPKCARCLLILWFDSGDLCLSCKFALTFVPFSVPSVQGGRGVPGPQGFGNELAQNNKSVSGGTMVCTCNGKDPVDKCACGVWGGGLSPGTPPHLDFEPKISQTEARRVQKEGLGKAGCGSVDSGWEGATLGQLGPPLHCRQQHLQGGGGGWKRQGVNLKMVFLCRPPCCWQSPLFDGQPGQPPPSAVTPLSPAFLWPQKLGPE